MRRRRKGGEVRGRRDGVRGKIGKYSWMAHTFSACKSASLHNSVPSFCQQCFSVLEEEDVY